MTPQALVVGAGPVGLTLAAELTRYGVPVRIVDQAAHRSNTSKALVLWSRTLELFDRAGCGISFVAAGQKVDAANIIAGRRTIGRVGLAGIASPHPYALMLPQSETERLLEVHLGGLGIEVDREVALEGFAHDGAAVTARLRRADGSVETLRADWLIGCDGAHSTVRHTLGLPFEGDTLQSDWILADIHMDGYPYPASEMTTWWHEEGVLVVFPISPRRFRVIADFSRTQGDLPETPTLGQVQAVIDRRGPGGLHLSDPVWLSGFRINERKVTAYRQGRVFVAGDAAHVHSPAGGQGMNTGMQDAFNLAWKLALVCRGACPPDPLLDSYSVERSAVGAQVLANAGRLTAVAVLKNHAAQAVRDLLAGFLLGLAPVRHAAADSLAEVTIGYPRSPLSGPGGHGLGHPAPGERMPPMDGTRPIGQGDTPRFVLCAEPGDAVSRLAGAHPDMVDPMLRPPPSPGAVWLVRPDGYTACVAKDTEIASFDTYLNRLRGHVTA